MPVAAAQLDPARGASGPDRQNGLLSIPLAAQCELFLLTSGSGLARRLLGLLVAARDFLFGLGERRGRRRAPRSWGVWLGRHMHSSTAP